MLGCDTIEFGRSVTEAAGSTETFVSVSPCSLVEDCKLKYEFV